MNSGDWNSGYSGNTEATYMIFRHNGAWVTSTNASEVGTSVSGVKLVGDSGSNSGMSVLNEGDVSADSIDDFIIGGPRASPKGREHKQEEHGLCLSNHI